MFTKTHHMCLFGSFGDSVSSFCEVPEQLGQEMRSNISRFIAQEVVMQLQHLKTDLKCVSSLLVNVGLKRVGFGLHCSDSLQDFFLSEKTS